MFENRDWFQLQLCSRQVQSSIVRQSSNLFIISHNPQLGQSVIKIIAMSRESRNGPQYQGAADDIKRGLEKIKQAQIEVMKELRREEPGTPRNHSLSYSRETNHDARHGSNYRMPHGDSQLRQRSERLEKEATESFGKESKLRQQLIAITEEARKSKQSAQRSQIKMREYEKGEQRALAKAQQALSNAVASEKKYAELKSEYDRIWKQKQRQAAEVKRLQDKRLSELANSNQQQSQLVNKIVRELRSANDCFGQLVAHINSHRCSKKDTAGSNTHNSVNLFAISTFEAQAKLNKHVGNIIQYLNNLQNWVPIQQVSSRVYAGQNAHNATYNYLSSSFRDDIRKIEEEIDGPQDKQKRVQQLHKENGMLLEINKKLQEELTEYQQEVVDLKEKIKQLKTEVSMSKLDQLTRDELDGRNKSKPKQKRALFEKYKNLAKLSESAPVDDLIKRFDSGKASSTEKYGPDPQKASQMQFEILEDRIVELEKENGQLMSRTKAAKENQGKLQAQIANLQEMNNDLQKQVAQLKDQNQLLESKKAEKPIILNAEAEAKQGEQIREMIDVISKLQQEKERLQASQSQLNQKLEDESCRYQAQVEELGMELEVLKKEIEEMRRESVINTSNSHSLIKEPCYNEEVVDEMWGKKQQLFQNAQFAMKQVTMSKKKPSKDESETQPTEKPQQDLNGFSRSTQQQQESPKPKIEKPSQQIIYGPPPPGVLRGSPSQSSVYHYENPQPTMVNHYTPMPNQQYQIHPQFVHYMPPMQQFQQVQPLQQLHPLQQVQKVQPLQQVQQLPYQPYYQNFAPQNYFLR